MEVLHLSFNTTPHSRLFITSYSSIKRYIEYCFAVTRATFTVSQQRQPLNQTLQIKERKNKIMGQVNRWRVVSYRSQNIFLWKSVTDSLMKITLYSCASSATSIDNNLFFITKVPRSLFGLKITSLRPGWSGYLSQIIERRQKCFLVVSFQQKQIN